MRGAERPAKVSWSHPFLPPLGPLSASAALQTFVDIADDTHEEEGIRQLLDLTGNLPLAVGLIASVAGSEGCDKALSRWKSESTQMLSDGYDKRSSLDISIMLSFTSSRMTSGAQELLSILSLIPDGLTEANLLQADFPISNILACKAVLLKTCLAYVDNNHRVKVLIPIREHTLRIHPPKNELKIKLRQHFHGLLDLWNQFQNLNIANIAPEISQNLGNLNTVLSESVETQSPDVVRSIHTILALNRFYQRTRAAHAPSFLSLSAKMAHWQDQPIFGDYLIECFQCSGYLPHHDVEVQIEVGNVNFSSRAPMEQGKIRCIH
jgi:hypothetical protein